MRYTSDKTSMPRYFEAITGLTIPGQEEYAGVLVEPGTQWEVLPYDNDYFLDQPLQIRKPPESGNGHVLSPLSGVLFVKSDGLELYTSYPKHSVKKWWPFPAPIDHMYDNLLDNQHVRPFPGLFKFKFDNLNGTFSSRIKPFLENLLALRFARHIYIWEQKEFKDGFEAARESLDSSSSSVFASILGQYVIRRVLENAEPYNRSFNEFISKNIIYNDTEGKIERLRRDNNLTGFELNDFSSIADSLIQNDKIGIRVSVSAPLFQMQPGEIVSVSSMDWRCYAHPFKPVAILDTVATKIETGVEENVNTDNNDHYDGLYFRSDLPEIIPNSINPSSSQYTNHKDKLSPKSGGFSSSNISGWNAYKSSTIRLMIESIINEDNKREILEESHVVLTSSDGSSSKTFLVELDKYEKWSLFPSNIRTVYAHWYTSGFLSAEYRANSLVRDVIGQRYDHKRHFKFDSGDNDKIYFHQLEKNDNHIYFHQPYAYEKPSEDLADGRKVTAILSSQFKTIKTGLSPSVPASIPLPEPINYNYIESANDHKEKGEEIGIRIRTYDYDISQHKLKIIEKKNNPDSPDYMVGTALREYETNSTGDIPGDFYAGNLGAYGIEEYVIRVPFAEIPNSLAGGGGTGNTNIGVNTIKHIELLKAKVIMARTYHMGRSTYMGVNDFNASKDSEASDGTKKNKKRGFSYAYNGVEISATENWQVMSLGHYNTVVREYKEEAENTYGASDLVRLTLEEAMYETWGEVFLHKGVTVEAIFKGSTGDPPNKNIGGVRGDRSGETKYHTRYYNALRRVFTPANHVDSASGAGFGQNGGEILARDAYSSAHQILHWYFFGCHVINAWGLGDCVSRFPEPKNPSGDPDSSNAYPWLAWKSGLTEVALPSLNVYTGLDDNIWKIYESKVQDEVHIVKHGTDIDGESFRKDAEVWGLGREANLLNSDKFDDIRYKDATGNEKNGFHVSRKLVSRLNRLVLKLSGPVIVLSNSEEDVAKGTDGNTHTYSYMQVEDLQGQGIHKLQIEVDGKYVKPTTDILKSLNLEVVKIESDLLVIQGPNMRVIRRGNGSSIDKEILDGIFGKNTENFACWVKLRNRLSPGSLFYLVHVK